VRSYLVTTALAAAFAVLPATAFGQVGVRPLGLGDPYTDLRLEVLELKVDRLAETLRPRLAIAQLAPLQQELLIDRAALLDRSLTDDRSASLERSADSARVAIDDSEEAIGALRSSDDRVSALSEEVDSLRADVEQLKQMMAELTALIRESNAPLP
jgi:chromosome segregation ATPase